MNNLEFHKKIHYCIGILNNLHAITKPAEIKKEISKVIKELRNVKGNLDKK